MFPISRMRRLRQPKIRDLVRETELTHNDLIYPMFVGEGDAKPIEIKSMPGQFRYPLGMIADEARIVADMGIPAIMLFGVPLHKDKLASSAYAQDGVIQKAVRAIKDELGDELLVITDVCLCEYMTHGHCGIVENKKILNDPTLELLAKTAVSHAQAGADIVAPSGMMDGMVDAIRTALDDEGFQDMIIMSYAVKYASAFYGPFREAAESGYAFGDRTTYQMDPANSDEALREAALDLDEGADIIMVKPALPYLDIVNRVKTELCVPTAAYSVSGEYAMLKAASQKGWLDEKAAVMESLLAIKRAGADMILTYFAKDAAEWLR
ncbi:MAG: porphobilinogen synthase [Methanosarcinales archaeon]|nr:MAG: porphobilinogen synthase [Methanosarcinales archaeon]